VEALIYEWVSDPAIVTRDVAQIIKLTIAAIHMNDFKCFRKAVPLASTSSDV